MDPVTLRIMSIAKRVYAETQVRAVAVGLQPLPSVPILPTVNRGQLGLASFVRTTIAPFTKPIQIKVNVRAFALSPADDPELVDTIRHEAAHIYCFKYIGDVNHDARWASIARILGATPRRCGGRINTETTVITQGSVGKWTAPKAQTNCGAINPDMCKRYAKKSKHCDACIQKLAKRPR